RYVWSPGRSGDSGSCCAITLSPLAIAGPEPGLVVGAGRDAQLAAATTTHGVSLCNRPATLTPP
ncbi:MAG: hypothetical protein ACPG4T_05775, partial [Nannocystaceae bacterium]